MVQGACWPCYTRVVTLPFVPKITHEIIEDLSPHDDAKQWFLKLTRRRMHHRDEQGRVSAEYVYDAVARKTFDAVAMVLYHEPTRRVCLRSSIRPALLLRDVPTVLWELPAGMLEPDEEVDAMAGVMRAAVRETHEEVGLVLAPEAFSELGGFLWMSPAVFPERIYFVAARVDHMQGQVPEGDGSPLEEGAVIAWPTWDEARALLGTAHICDAKTEIGLRRLAEKLGWS